MTSDGLLSVEKNLNKRDGRRHIAVPIFVLTVSVVIVC